LGFLSNPVPSIYVLPLLLPKSYNIAAFALDLKTAYERDHMVFGLLSLANLAQNEVLQEWEQLSGRISFTESSLRKIYLTSTKV
jgi:hypothetical protein